MFYVLMTRKTQAAYTDLFQYIEKNIMQLNPNSFVTDFEKASRNALRSIYGDDIKFVTCWFHFCQAVRRKMLQFPALQKIIKTNSAAEELYQELLALPLLPATEIHTAFVKLQSDANILNVVKYFTVLFKYFKNQWFKRVSFSYSYFYVSICSLGRSA